MKNRELEKYGKSNDTLIVKIERKLFPQWLIALLHSFMKHPVYFSYLIFQTWALKGKKEESGKEEKGQKGRGKEEKIVKSEKS